MVLSPNQSCHKSFENLSTNTNYIQAIDRGNGSLPTSPKLSRHNLAMRSNNTSPVPFRRQTSVGHDQSPAASRRQTVSHDQATATADSQISTRHSMPEHSPLKQQPQQQQHPQQQPQQQQQQPESASAVLSPVPPNLVVLLMHNLIAILDTLFN